MVFNYRLAVKGDEIGFNAAWFAADPNFLSLYGNLKKILGINELSDEPGIIELKKICSSKNFEHFLQAYNENNGIGFLQKLVNSDRQGNPKINSSGIPEYTYPNLLKLLQSNNESINNVVSSMVNMFNQAREQQLYQQLANTQNIKSLHSQLNEDQIAQWITNELLEEIKKNPHLAYVLSSNRPQLGAGAGIPQNKTSFDVLDITLSDQFSNDIPSVDNFLNLLATLMHQYAITTNTTGQIINQEFPDTQITLEQEYAFVAMCKSGASESSRSSQYDVLKWIETTESANTENTTEGIIGKFEDFVRSDKDLIMLERIGNMVLGDTTVVKIKENSGGNKKKFQETLLSAIPNVYHNLYYTVRSIDKMSDLEKEIYIDRHPELKVLFDEDIIELPDPARKIRTKQLLNLRQGVVSAWGNHYKEVFQNIKQKFPQLTEPLFLQLIYLKPDNQDAIQRFIRSMRIEQEQIPILINIINTKDALLDLGNLFGVNIPGVARLWSIPTVIAGREVMDKDKVQSIQPLEIIQQAGFNDLLINTKDFTRNQEEDLESYKQRMAVILSVYVNKLSKDGSFVFSSNPGARRARLISPLSVALVPDLEKRKEYVWDEVYSIYELLNSVMSEINGEILNIDGEDDSLMEISNEDIPENTKLSKQSMTARTERKKVLEDLLDRVALNDPSFIGDLRVDAKLNKIPDFDPEFRAIGMSSPSMFAHEILYIFRDNFNLPICSYEFQMNSPEQCTMNPNGFAMDFVVLADKLIVQDNKLTMKPQILLIGEAFGYDTSESPIPIFTPQSKLDSIKDAKEKKKLENINKRKLALYKQQMGDSTESGALSIDKLKRLYVGTTESGDVTLLVDYRIPVNNNGEIEYNVEKTEPATVGIEYAMRSSWKEPHQTAISHILSADTIYVPPFDPTTKNEKSAAIMSLTHQLDNSFILWRTYDNASAAVKYAIKILGENGAVDKNIIDKYINNMKLTKPYSNTQLYAKTLLSQFDLENIIIPLYKSNPDMFIPEEMAEYRKVYIELSNKYSSVDDLQSKQKYLEQIANISKQLFGIIQEKYQQYINGEPLDPTPTGLERQRKILEVRNKINNIVNSLFEKPQQDYTVQSVTESFPYSPRKVSSNGDYDTFPQQILS